MIKDRMLLIGLVSLVVGVGVYFGRGAFVKIAENRQNLLGALAETARDGAGSATAHNSSPDERAGDTLAASTVGCSFKTSETLSHGQVILNEIAWMGNVESANNEWMELKNSSSETADISGWQLVNQNENIHIVFKNGTKIPPGGLYLLERGSQDLLPGIKADQFYTGAIKNSDEGLRLFDGRCALKDEVFASIGSEKGSGKHWPAGDNTTKKTMERDPKTLAWHTSAQSGGTPKKENSASPVAPPDTKNATTTQERVSPQQSSDALATTNQMSEKQTTKPTTTAGTQTACPQSSQRTLSHAVLINEVAWAGTASAKTTQEWIELKNNSGAKISLDGWQLQNAGQSIKVPFAGSDSIPAGGLYLLERGSVDFIPGIKADKFYTGAIKNNDEALRLFDKNCAVVDEVVANVGTGKNWQAGTASPNYRTAERSPDLSWHTYNGPGTNGIFGTPRAENSSPPTISQNQASQQPPVSTSTPTQPLAPIYYALQVSKSGAGTGSVTSNPSGISCAHSCSEDSEDFISGKSVSLTATPESGAEFAGWSGACSGNVICTIAMNGNASVTALFNQTIPTSPPTSSPAESAPSAPNAVDHIVISEMQIAGVDSADQFIRLYNPTGTDIDLSTWSIQYHGPSASTFSKKNFDSGKKIPAGGYFLIARGLDASGTDGYRGTLSGDYMTERTFKLGVSGGTVFLVRTATLLTSGNDQSIDDKVAYGSGTSLSPEGSAFTPVPAANHSMKRKVSGGMIVDTNDNAADFEVN